MRSATGASGGPGGSSTGTGRALIRARTNGESGRGRIPPPPPPAMRGRGACETGDRLGNYGPVDPSSRAADGDSEDDPHMARLWPTSDRPRARTRVRYLPVVELGPTAATGGQRRQRDGSWACERQREQRCTYRTTISEGSNREGPPRRAARIKDRKRTAAASFRAAIRQFRPTGDCLGGEWPRGAPGTLLGRQLSVAADRWKWPR